MQGADYHYGIIIITVTGHTMTCHYAMCSCSKECILEAFFSLLYNCKPVSDLGFFVKRQVRQYNHTLHFSSRLLRIIEQEH